MNSSVARLKEALTVSNLAVTYADGTRAVRGVSFTVEPGESVGIVGESGCGKSSIALALMGILDRDATAGGSVVLSGRAMERFSRAQWNAYRWREIALVFQSGADVLNPVLTVEEQIAETIAAHTDLRGTAITERITTLMEWVGLDRRWASSYPHQLSGGMLQKVLIAMALSCFPRVLVVDEPTMALDPEATFQVVTLLKNLQRKHHFALVVISHELDVIARLTTRTLVMYGGTITEEGPTDEILRDPAHPYTRGLLYASPAVNPYRDMWGIPAADTSASDQGCPFYDRCNQRVDACRTTFPLLQSHGPGRSVACIRGGIVTVLRAQNVSREYRVRGEVVVACEDCSFTVRAGEVVALIGESGSGKSTLAEIVSGARSPDAGRVEFEGEEVSGNNVTSRTEALQIVFQDPVTAINGRFSVLEAVREPLDILKTHDKATRDAVAIEALRSVGLPDRSGSLSRRCATLSGGEGRRVILARALVMRPRVLIADEISAMLDPSSAANILRMLKGLQVTRGFAMLYITHDIALAQKMADRVCVMHAGRIVESGGTQEVFANPATPYTRVLLSHAAFQPPRAIYTDRSDTTRSKEYSESQ